MPEPAARDHEAFTEAVGKGRNGRNNMGIIVGTIREILDATEFLTIVSTGDEGPHLVANWGDYQRGLGIEGDTIVLPAGHYNRTEENLRKNGRVQVMAASRKVAGSHGPGQGCVLSGRGEIVTDGPFAEKAKAKFRWARGALLIHVEAASLQL
jgi:hypothetical protein